MGKAAAVKKNIWTLKAPQDAAADPYARFLELDGSHPWKDWVPEGFLDYKARKLNRGQIAYFNFDLAKEMGLIPEDHPHAMNRALKQRILETFAIRIINEYDIHHRVSFPEADIKPGKFMATRYLQLQHADKKGGTSGDGRCVWNGVVSHKGRLWDVSSRGTGVTALAPGAVTAGRPLRSGNTEFGYGCGLAEIDELYAAAIMAEIFHRRGIRTERVLALIDFGDGYGIGVRAAPNLIRPAHLFMHLKQGHWEALRRSTDYLILRQQKNGEWKFGVHSPDRYHRLLEEVALNFAFFAAQLEREYIFAWLDWDGDNVLANAGIIDYGSVRQFGLRHDQYRYDDVERWSTNLNEQKGKARLTLQVFAQMVDFLVTRKKKPLKTFARHPILARFDEHHAQFVLERFLYQLGFKERDRDRLLAERKNDVAAFYRTFLTFERAKTRKKIHEVADGINRPAIFNMRSVARELPAFLAASEEPWELQEMDAEHFFHLMLADTASGPDTRLTPVWARRIARFQNQYKLLFSLFGDGADRAHLAEVAERSRSINRADRLTGNALLFIVSKILRERRQGLPHDEVQKIIDQLVIDQTGPGERPTEQRPLAARRSQQLYKAVLELVEGYKEDI